MNDSVTRDLGGCVFTFISSILVYNEVLTEKFSAYLDPVIALVYIIFFISSCVNITKDSCLILLQTIPGSCRTLKSFFLFIYNRRKCGHFTTEDFPAEEVPGHSLPARVPHLDFHSGHSGLHGSHHISGTAVK